MLPVLYRPAVSYLRVGCDKILLFLIYCVPYNYVILGLLSGGGGGGARYFLGSTIVLGGGGGG